MLRPRAHTFDGEETLPKVRLPEQLGIVRVAVTVQHRDSNGHAKRTARITLSGGDGMVRNWQPKPRPMSPGWQCRCPDGCSERHGARASTASATNGSILRPSSGDRGSPAAGRFRRASTWSEHGALLLGDRLCGQGSAVPTSGP
jgi:hypothetical protein